MLGVTEKIYVRLKVNHASASIERLSNVFNVPGIE